MATGEPEFVDAILDPFTSWTGVRLMPHEALEFTCSNGSKQVDGLIEEGEALPTGAKVGPGRWRWFLL